MNVGFGSSGNTGNFNFAKGTITGNQSPAQEVGAPRSRTTDETKLAGVMIKAMNTISFNHHAFAYHFLEKAPGPVIENTMRLFDAILDGLVQRFDLDQCQDSGEYNSAVMAKRIQEAIEKYK